MRLEAVSGDVDQVLPALRALLEGTGPALALGEVGLPADEVPDGTAAVIATSGSSGVPKQVVLSRDALVAGARATARRVGAGAWLLALPAGYVAGLQVLTRSLLAGTEPVVLQGSFQPQAFAEATLTMPAVEDAFCSLVPAQLTRLLDAADRDRTVSAALRRFRAILIGGQALPATLQDRAQAAGAAIVRTYGATETCGGCVYDGIALDGVGVAIVDDEVRLAGPMLADGYLDDEELTGAAFTVDASGTRWYRTGDTGTCEGAVLHVTGRLDNVIVSGGVNISLDRVERVVREVPGLAGAVVVRVADERWGEASVIVAVHGGALRRSEAVQLEEARRAVAARIGAPARPARLVLVDALPMLPSGKPDRDRIRSDLA